RALQMLSTAAGTPDRVGAREWPVSTGRISSGSPALACPRQASGSAHATFTACACDRPVVGLLATTGVAPLGGPAAREAESNTTRRNADPARLRMFLRPGSHTGGRPSNS